VNLRLRIILILVSIEILTLIAILASTSIYYYQAHLHQFEIRATEVSKLLSVAVGEALMVQQYSSLSEIIDAAFFEIEGLDYILVTKENGEVLAEKRRGRDLISTHKISVSSVITIGSHANIIALLDVTYCTDALYDHIHDHYFILIIIGLVGVSFSSYWTYHILTKVTNTITTISDNVINIIHGEIPNEIPTTREDELGKLVNNYNKLVHELRGIS